MERASMGEPAKTFSFDNISLFDDEDNPKDEVIDVEPIPVKEVKEVKRKGHNNGGAVPLENKPDKVQCVICKRWFKSITGNHLKRIHHMTLTEYIRQYPEAPTNNAFVKDFQKKILENKELQEKVKDPNANMIIDEEQLQPPPPTARESKLTPNDYYIDAEGRKRFKDTKELVTGSGRALSRGRGPGRPKESDVERFLRQDLIGANGEQVFYELKNILVYDQKKAGHKVPYYRAEHKLRAAQLLLEYGLGKPIQRSESNSTVKTMSVSIGVKLPEDLDIGDF